MDRQGKLSFWPNLIINSCLLEFGNLKWMDNLLFFVGGSTWLNFIWLDEFLSTFLYSWAVHQHFDMMTLNVITVSALIRGKGRGFWRDQKVKKIINHPHEVKIRKFFEEAFFNFFFYKNLPRSFWVIVHPQEVKIGCNFEEALRESSSTSENRVQFLRRNKKINLAK